MFSLTLTYLFRYRDARTMFKMNVKLIMRLTAKTILSESNLMIFTFIIFIVKNLLDLWLGVKKFPNEGAIPTTKISVKSSKNVKPSMKKNVAKFPRKLARIFRWNLSFFSYPLFCLYKQTFCLQVCQTKYRKECKPSYGYGERCKKIPYEVKLTNEKRVR